MASFNQVTLIGNLGQDPSVHDSKDLAITKLSIATSRYVKSEKKEVTDWHNVTLFGQPATYTNANLRKGDLVHIIGELRTSKWTDKDGKDRYSTEIIAEQIQGLNLKSKNGKGKGKTEDEDSGAA